MNMFYCEHFIIYPAQDAFEFCDPYSIMNKDPRVARKIVVNLLYKMLKLQSKMREHTQICVYAANDHLLQ